MNQVEKMPWEYTNRPMNQQNKHEEVLVSLGDIPDCKSHDFSERCVCKT